jgi:hypothetical protein
METIATYLGIERHTAERHTKLLCREGFLEDTTPNARDRPHVYRDTGRARILGLVEAHVAGTQVVQKLPPRNGGGTQTTTSSGVEQKVPPGGTQNTTEVEQKVPPRKRRGGTESSTSRQERDQETNDETVGGADAPLSPPFPEEDSHKSPSTPPTAVLKPTERELTDDPELADTVAALCEVTEQDWNILDSDQRYRLLRTAKALRNNGYSAERIRLYKEQAWPGHWKAKKGEKLTVRTLLQELPSFQPKGRREADRRRYIGGELAEFIEH